jgi:hypothetical protein
MRHLVTVLVLVFATSAMMAADDGQTQPRINYATNSSSTTNVDIVPSTNGSGNVKGVHCLMSSNISTTASAVVTFTVDGGAAQIVTLEAGYFPYFDTAGLPTVYTGWVPYNIRFASSIRVQVKKQVAATGTAVSCGVSWALD